MFDYIRAYLTLCHRNKKLLELLREKTKEIFYLDIAVMFLLLGNLVLLLCHP